MAITVDRFLVHVHIVSLIFHIIVLFPVIGVVIGSVLTYIFKWNGKRNILFTSIVTLVSVPFLAVYLIHCPTVNLAGVITPYNNE